MIDTAVALKNVKAEVEKGYDPTLGFKEAQRCLNCDIETVFAAELCIECDACVDICPMDCITFTENGEETELRERLRRAGAQSDARHLHRRRPQDRPHHGQRRRRLPALQPLRRTLPDRRLGHAEILPRNDARGLRENTAAGGGGMSRDIDAATLPLEGGGQGGGEIVALISSRAPRYDLTPPLTPPSQGAGDGWRRAQTWKTA